MISVINDEISNNIEEVIDTLKSVDVQLLELRKINNKYLFQIKFNELRYYKKLLIENGIKISLIDSPIGKNKFDNELELILLGKYIEIAKLFDCKNIRIFTDIDNDITKGLKKYNEIARDNDIFLLIENEPGTYGEDCNNLLNLMKNNYSNIKILYDIENYYRINIDYIEAFNMLKPYIDYIHLRDVKNNKYVYLFDGNINIREILKRKNENVIVSLETHLPLSSGFDKKELFINSLRRIRNE